MIADIEIQEPIVGVIDQQETLLLVQDIELIHIGGGTSGGCHF